jgi:hypothetical protein
MNSVCVIRCYKIAAVSCRNLTSNYSRRNLTSNYFIHENSSSEELMCAKLIKVSQELLEMFSKRSLVEKLKIIKVGLPCPPLSNVKSIHKDKRTTEFNFESQK